jgi:hypothetical protein
MQRLRHQSIPSKRSRLEPEKPGFRFEVHGLLYGSGTEQLAILDCHRVPSSAYANVMRHHAHERAMHKHLGVFGMLVVTGMGFHLPARAALHHPQPSWELGQ